MCHKSITFFIAFILLLLPGCAVPAPTAAPTFTLAPEQATRTPIPSSTPAPTETPWPSRTPTVTETPLPSATLPPTPDPALGETELIGLAWYDDYDLLVSFQFPGPVDPDDYRVTVEEKDYICEVIAQHPDRLYCRGQGARVLATTWVRVFQTGSQQPGFEKEVWVPFFDNDYSSYYH